MTEPAPGAVRVGAWRLEADVRELHGPDGEVRRIGPTAARVLGLLVEADGAVVSKETLVEGAWAGDFVSDEAAAQFEQLRAVDRDRWLKGMRGLRAKAMRDLGGLKLTEFYKLM